MGQELFRRWRETGATVLLITHALDEAAMLADRVGGMSARPGRFLELIETGWPRSRDSTPGANEAFRRVTSRTSPRRRGEAMRAPRRTCLPPGRACASS